jgi:hypothetical protein
MSKLTWRRAAFWGAVGAVSIFANFALEIVADRVPQLGLARFVAYTHKGAS